MFSSSKITTHVSSRHNSSFVNLPDYSLAQIKWLFTHTFVSDEYDMALLQVFSNPVQDIDTNLYYIDNVSLDTESNLYYSADQSVEIVFKIVPITSLSAPHVVAYEGSKLWYISFTG